MEQPLVNRVAKSGLITINLEEYYPQSEVVGFDLKDFLYMELILKEKEFRAALKEYDWSQHEGQVLAVHCSTDAIIPVWAYMLVAVHAADHAADVFEGTPAEFLRFHYDRVIAALDPADYADQRIVVKGCSNRPVPPSAYLKVTRRLQPVVKSIMYGEPCSTVPIYKRK